MMNDSGRGIPLPALDELAAGIGELRPLPAATFHVLAIAESDRFSAQALAEAVAADQVLSVRVLRLANSAYYGFPRHIGSVRDAVMLLGFRSVRAATLASCVMNALPGSTTIDYHRFWRFSITVGILAELVARVMHHRAEEAFTAGVLHNIGRLALDQHYPQLLARAREHAATRDVPIARAERAVLGFTDAEFGGALARRWSLPEELVEAVARHQLDLDDLPDRNSLAADVIRARLFARACGISDGVEPMRHELDVFEWSVPPLSSALRIVGGMDRVAERAEAFVASAVGS